MLLVPEQSAAGTHQQISFEPIQTLIVDRQPLFVAALGSLLEGSAISSHVLTSSRSDVGLDIVRNEAVDLVCCELQAEPITGLELVRILTEERPDLPVILLADSSDDEQLASALAANVSGLFSKSSGSDEFLNGVKAVLAGHRAIGSGIIGQLLTRFTSHGAGEQRRPGNHLSPTELEILAMIGQAQSIPTIAASRGISHKTVRNHLAKIYRKLDLHGRTEAMLWAARMGLTSN